MKTRKAEWAMNGRPMDAIEDIDAHLAMIHEANCFLFEHDEPTYVSVIDLFGNRHEYTMNN